MTKHWSMPNSFAAFGPFRLFAAQSSETQGRDQQVGAAPCAAPLAVFAPQTFFLSAYHLIELILGQMVVHASSDTVDHR